MRPDTARRPMTEHSMTKPCSSIQHQVSCFLAKGSNYLNMTSSVHCVATPSHPAAPALEVGALGHHVDAHPFTPAAGTGLQQLGNTGPWIKPA